MKMALKITEDWIKERTKLDHDKLEEVRSLSLPGNYQEKIASFSISLCNFTNLQELDVSRNAIVTLDGLSHLKLLETLNLYYNRVPDLKEVFKLRKNQHLKVLDLRLNPVTKTEADYRLFVVHMLPLLRNFDDRLVREKERRAALMHFSDEQALDMDHHKNESFEDVEREQPRVSAQPRAEYVRNMMKKPTYVTDEDTCLDVADLMNRNGGDVRNERVPTGGVRMEPEIEDHTHADLVRIAQKENPVKYRQDRHSEELNGYNKRNSRGSESDDQTYKPAFSSKKSAPIRNEAPYEDEEAYTKFKSVAHYTRHPGSIAPAPTVGQKMSEPNCHTRSNHSESNSSVTPESLQDEFSSLPNVKRLSFGESTVIPDESTRSSVQSRFLDEFLDLVDRYWNGSKSLHYHKKFKSLIEKPFARYEEGLASSKEIQIRALQDKVSTIAAENKSLHTKLHSLSKNRSMPHQDGSNQKEQEALRSRLQLSMSDNKILRKKICDLEEKMQSKSDEKVHFDNDRAMELEKQKRSLTQQVATMKFQLKNYESLDDLTKMLQESHKSLIATNDRLLSELDETRNRHQSEVEQLKWSYDQLRKTSQLLGSTYNDEPSHTNGY